MVPRCVLEIVQQPGFECLPLGAKLMFWLWLDPVLYQLQTKMLHWWQLRSGQSHCMLHCMSRFAARPQIFNLNGNRRSHWSTALSFSVNILENTLRPVQKVFLHTFVTCNFKNTYTTSLVVLKVSICSFLFWAHFYNNPPHCSSNYSHLLPPYR